MNILKKNFGLKLIAIVSLVSFVCGVFFTDLKSNLLRQGCGDKVLAWPALNEDDHMSLVGNWVLTKDSLGRFRAAMERIDRRSVSSGRMAQDVFPTCQQMMLTATRLRLPNGEKGVLIGTQDTWPLLPDGMPSSDSLESRCVDARLTCWKIGDDIPPGNASQFESVVGEGVESWLFVSYEWMPDIWKTGCYAIGKRGDCLVLRTKCRLARWDEIFLLEWRRVSDSIEPRASPK